jgi:ABC-type bacteriocin/lantibiotic exporter with double-glycine peptidase domain
MRPNPEIQGTLDCLCGLYAITNAYKLALNTEDAEADIFRFILAKVSSKKVVHYIEFGMTMPEVLKILKKTAKSFGLRYETVDCERVGRFRTLEKERSPLIIGVEDNNNLWGGGHWTVIRKITPKKIKVQDSSLRISEVSRRSFPEFDMNEIIRVYKP